MALPITAARPRSSSWPASNLVLNLHFDIVPREVGAELVAIGAEFVGKSAHARDQSRAITISQFLASDDRDEEGDLKPGEAQGVTRRKGRTQVPAHVDEALHCEPPFEPDRSERCVDLIPVAGSAMVSSFPSIGLGVGRGQPAHDHHRDEKQPPDRCRKVLVGAEQIEARG